MMKLIMPAVLLLAGCNTVPAPGTGPGTPLPSSACAIVNSSDWQAWVDAMPGPDSHPKLIVTGKVTQRNGGRAFFATQIQAGETSPAQVTADLRAMNPVDPSTGVSTVAVRGEWPMNPPVGSVTVTCGGQVLAHIAPVGTAL
jgi:hypothetical protein